MSFFRIPINSANPSFVQAVDLDGETFRLFFRWNARQGLWYLSIRDVEDVSIAESLCLVRDTSLLRHHVDFTIRPIGELTLIEPTASLDAPSRSDLDENFFLLYIDNESVQELVG